MDIRDYVDNEDMELIREVVLLKLQIEHLNKNIKTLEMDNNNLRLIISDIQKNIHVNKNIIVEIGEKITNDIRSFGNFTTPLFIIGMMTYPLILGCWR